MKVRKNEMSLKKSLKWILLAAPILNILIVLSGEESVSKWLPSELTFIVVAIGILYFCYGRKSTCPECRKIFALKKTKQEIVGQEDVSVLVETKMRNNRQEVVGTGEQYVPGVRTTYREYYTCKHCGNVVTRDYTKSRAKM